MPTNTLVTNSDLAEHLLAHFINQCQFARLANRYYQDEYRSVNGFMRGNTIRILRPTYFVPRQGPSLSPSAISERETFLTLQYQDGQDIELSSVQMTTDIDDLSVRVLRPIAIGLANLVDVRIATEVALKCYNKIGTGSAQLNSFASFNSWEQQLFSRGVIGDYEAILNATDSTALQNSLQNAFNTTLNEEISIYGRLGELANVSVYKSQNVQPHTNGTWTGSPAVDGANQSGSTLLCKAFGAAATINRGDVFYISNGTAVNAINPVPTPSGVGNRSIGTTADALQRFIVTEAAVASGGGAVTLTIDPPIVLTGPYQNVTNAPDDSALLTVVGGAATLFRNNFMFTKEAISCAIVPLIVPPGAVNASVMTDPETGISMRVIDSYDAQNDVAIKRVDLLYGIQIFGEYLAGFAAGT